MKNLRIFGGIALFFLGILYADNLFATLPMEIPRHQTLIIDFKNVRKIPENFRSTWKDLSKVPSNISILGLKDINIAGSHEFSEQAICAVLRENPIISVVVDVRQETHFFVNGNAVTLFAPKNWGNKGLSDDQILKNEEILYKTLREKRSLTLQEIYDKDPRNPKLFREKPVAFNYPVILSEEETVQSKGLSYIRLFVTDSMIPNSLEVDRFIEFVRMLPRQTGLYFHCRDGRHRTTMFMALYDMMINAKLVSFKDIIGRQFYLGGVNLNEIEKSGYEHTLSQQRLAFLKKFYEYAKNNEDGFSTLWSQFLNR